MTSRQVSANERSLDGKEKETHQTSQRLARAAVAQGRQMRLAQKGMGTRRELELEKTPMHHAWLKCILSLQVQTLSLHNAL